MDFIKQIFYTISLDITNYVIMLGVGVICVAIVLYSKHTGKLIKMRNGAIVMFFVVLLPLPARIYLDGGRHYFSEYCGNCGKFVDVGGAAYFIKVVDFSNNTVELESNDPFHPTIRYSLIDFKNMHVLHVTNLGTKSRCGIQPY